MAPVHRVAARVLPVSPAGEVLLVQGQDPARPGELHWVSVGGAVETGESLPEAGVRELAEETGLRVVASALLGPVHRATHPFSWAGVDYVSDNSFFAVPLDRHVEVSFDHLEPAEVGNLLAAGWWAPDDLRREGGAVTDDLPDIMELAIHAVRRGET